MLLFNIISEPNSVLGHQQNLSLRQACSLDPSPSKLQICLLLSCAHQIQIQKLQPVSDLSHHYYLFIFSIVTNHYVLDLITPKQAVTFLLDLCKYCLPLRKPIHMVELFQWNFMCQFMIITHRSLFGLMCHFDSFVVI